MRTYTYRALNDKGRSVRGTLNASSDIELHHLLRELGLEMVSCKAEGQGVGKRLSLGVGAVSARDLVVFCRELEQLLGAGVPLLQAIADLRDGAPNPILRDALAEVHKSLSEGESLSSAFARHPRIFNETFIALIASGENTGKLGETLKKLGDYIAWTDDLARRAKKAVRYPAFMSVVMVGVTIFMMMFVVPQVVAFLKSSTPVLPLPTRALIATSNFFAQWWWAIVGAPIVAIAIVKIGSRLSSGFAYQVDRLLLATPVIGDIIEKLNLARFGSMMAIMYRSGIPIVQSLHNCRKVVINRAMRVAVDDLIERISAGESMSLAMQRTGAFPKQVARLISVGEASGNLDQIFDMIAETYNQEADEAIQSFIGTIEPGLTLVMGALMAWIALGVFGPIYDNFEQMDI